MNKPLLLIALALVIHVVGSSIVMLANHNALSDQIQFTSDMSDQVVINRDRIINLEMDRDINANRIGTLEMKDIK